MTRKVHFSLTKSVLWYLSLQKLQCWRNWNEWISGVHSCHFPPRILLPRKWMRAKAKFNIFTVSLYLSSKWTREQNIGKGQETFLTIPFYLLAANHIQHWSLEGQKYGRFTKTNNQFQLTVFCQSACFFALLLLVYLSPATIFTPHWSFADSGLFRERWVHKTDKAFTVFSQTNSTFDCKEQDWFLTNSSV